VPVQAADYLREIKQSSPTTIQQMRTRPLLLWDKDAPQNSINLSDSGVSN
jgi:hypothetical protein